MRHDPPVAPAARTRPFRLEAIPDWQPIGTVHRAYLRTASSPEPIPVRQVEALAGQGLVDDQHRCAHSPRQVLVAGDPAYQRFDLADSTLRESLRIDFATTDLRSGDLLRVGDDVVLWLTFHCEPCIKLERRRPGLVKTIGAHRGMLARVLHGGTYRVGDPVSLARAVLSPISEDWRERVLAIASAVPDGQQITYRQLAEMTGVAYSYCRGFPRVLGRLPSEYVDRVVSAANGEPRKPWSGDRWFDVLGT